MTLENLPKVDTVVYIGPLTDNHQIDFSGKYRTKDTIHRIVNNSNQPVEDVVWIGKTEVRTQIVLEG